ncbi:hypothetical protein QE152_g19716 [Popillia japonica]|uniref:Uncharacterized protein n=1 Tax=Popillia japonica TaxID=7064 RepID=A0AAW1KRL8_POPJA
MKHVFFLWLQWTWQRNLMEASLDALTSQNLVEIILENDIKRILGFKLTGRMGNMKHTFFFYPQWTSQGSLVEANLGVLTSQNLVDINFENETNWRIVVVMARNIISCKQKDEGMGEGHIAQ